MVLAECCFTPTETVGLLGTAAQDGHLDFHTAPELCLMVYTKGITTIGTRRQRVVETTDLMLNFTCTTFFFFVCVCRFFKSVCVCECVCLWFPQQVLQRLNQHVRNKILVKTQLRHLRFAEHFRLCRRLVKVQPVEVPIAYFFGKSPRYVSQMSVLVRRFV